MEKSLQNENLSINVNSFGGALSSIKDKDGLEYLWQGVRNIGADRPLCFFLSVAV